MNIDEDADRRWMRIAIQASARALALGNNPFGAALVCDGKLLLEAENEQITNGDCMDHAETVLVKRASVLFGAPALRGSTVYASGEPCAMCAGAMFWAGVGRIVFAATSQDIKSCLGTPVLAITCTEVLASAEPPPQIDGPLLQDEAIEILRLAVTGR